MRLTVSQFRASLNNAADFIPAVEESVKGAVAMARELDITSLIKDFDWHGPPPLKHQACHQDSNTTWPDNISNVATAVANFISSALNLQFLIYQQRCHIEIEIARRVATGVTQKTAANDVYRELLPVLGLSNGHSNSSKSKSKSELIRLHATNPALIAFICSKHKKWRRIFRNEHGKLQDETLTGWIDIIGPICQHIWRMLTLLKTQPPEWKRSLVCEWEKEMKALFLARDREAGLSYTPAEASFWSFFGATWAAMRGVVFFRKQFGAQELFPGTAYRGPVCRFTPEAGAWELHGFFGNANRLRNYALTTANIAGRPSLVSTIELREGDYLGIVNAKLHMFADAEDKDTGCWIEGPEGILCGLC